MNQPFPFLPSGSAPGAPPPSEERPPEAVYYFRIYALLYIVLLFCVAGFALYGMTLPVRSSSRPRPTEDIAVGLGLFLFSGTMIIPFIAALAGGRKRWVHTLGTILIIISMISGCCWLFAIPLLVVWQKAETKHYYGIY